MPNREKAIEGLEWILQDDRFGFGVNWDTDCEPKTEEEQAGYNIQMAISLLKEQPEIIRCKDCRWYDEKISFCDNCHLPREQTFFCADGKRREENAID